MHIARFHLMRPSRTRRRIKDSVTTAWRPTPISSKATAVNVVDMAANTERGDDGASQP